MIEELAPGLKGHIRTKQEQSVSLMKTDNRIGDLPSREPKHAALISKERGLPVTQLLNLVLSLEPKEILKPVNGRRFYNA